MFRGIYLIDAWSTRKPNNLLIQHKKEIKYLFTPNNFNFDKFKKYRKISNNIVLVGVYIR